MEGGIWTRNGNNIRSKFADTAGRCLKTMRETGESTYLSGTVALFYNSSEYFSFKILSVLGKLLTVYYCSHKGSITPVVKIWKKPFNFSL